MWYGTGTSNWSKPEKLYNPSGFTISEFFDYLQYRGKIVPFKVNKSRWNAMLKWYTTRHKNKDWVVNEITGNKE